MMFASHIINCISFLLSTSYGFYFIFISVIVGFFSLISFLLNGSGR